MLNPGELTKREEEEKDKSESAEKERRYIDRKAKEEREEKENSHLMGKLKLKEAFTRPEERAAETKEIQKDPDIQRAGTGPENAIAPEGTRGT